jgi:dienelactone hydrolase
MLARLVTQPLRLAVVATALLASAARVGPVAANERPAELVRFEIAWAKPNPHQLRGYLRRPAAEGRHPAVVLLHDCVGDWRGIDERWGKLIASWGYAALTVDSYGSRGIEAACNNELITPDLFDAYSALMFLRASPFVIADRIAVMGVSTGGTRTLWSVERGFIERQFREKFRAAVALYPQCVAVNGRITVPTLVLIGERDEWTRAADCRELAQRAGGGDSGAGESGARAPLRLVIYPGAHHAFDNPAFRTGRRFLWHWREYDKAAADRAAEEVRAFLREALGG